MNKPTREQITCAIFEQCRISSNTEWEASFILNVTELESLSREELTAWFSRLSESVKNNSFWWTADDPSLLSFGQRLRMTLHGKGVKPPKQISFETAVLWATNTLQP